MAERVVPTMSVTGYVTGVTETIDRMFAYWLTAQYSQTYLARGNIHSLQYLIQQYDGNPERLCDAVVKDLKNYFTGPFDAATVTCNPRYATSERDEKFYMLEIDIKVSNGDIGYDVGRRLLEIEDGIFKRIVGTL
ncbi:hypothetical protein RAY_236 [Erwinia phage vB_EamM_RAY]|uniref:Uncharacterized protein n=10 Tax=Agricanvirus TaxID=1984776 RepID=A0A173GEE2_9CAUD|nr:hypothetical protein Ea357_234 [Erwinia phage Ea35-70]YP_009605385.1 hypothetical protein FDH97_gp242 [Erwinia phage vB_EamM_Deimos-Minion]YP_009605702.1 hypothetical protein FDH98_gp282 [Erwinia phage vB_EamM_RAY]YP_009606024.1 hypothetical protein FDH99_gp285 [Erwinia phage vB_EamM_Simmy50]YP_009606345.1 hypothetical protein FDI00_gp239 [Erwinia phage vB_EamM_Special G]YP_009621978.1 hypothetical protein FDJ23_gp237 [Erwinia phage vB_EamM_Desertfox]AUG86025.1 hypothetical protein BOSOLAP